MHPAEGQPELAIADEERGARSPTARRQLELAASSRLSSGAQPERGGACAGGGQRHPSQAAGAPRAPHGSRGLSPPGRSPQRRAAALRGTFQKSGHAHRSPGAVRVRTNGNTAFWRAPAPRSTAVGRCHVALPASARQCPAAPAPAAGGCGAARGSQPLPWGCGSWGAPSQRAGPGRGWAGHGATSHGPHAVTGGNPPQPQPHPAVTAAQKRHKHRDPHAPPPRRLGVCAGFRPPGDPSSRGAGSFTRVCSLGTLVGSSAPLGAPARDPFLRHRRPAPSGRRLSGR